MSDYEKTMRVEAAAEVLYEALVDVLPYGSEEHANRHVRLDSA